jgi:hypothetical protein
MEVEFGSVTKKKVVNFSFSQKKGRQLFVAAKMAPPWQFPGYATDVGQPEMSANSENQA